MIGPTGPTTEPGRTDPDLQNSGSAEPEFLYLAIGRIVRAHGVRGEVSVQVLTDFPERFEQTEWVYIGSENEAELYRLTAHRWHKRNVLLSLDGIADRNLAERLVGQFVQVPREEAVSLPPGSYYLFQLVGLRVVTQTGEKLGVIREVLETGANDVYVVQRPDGSDLLLPAIPDVVLSVDLEQGQMLVHLLDGLL
jgi:16S rRNA processing protein RimM